MDEAVSARLESIDRRLDQNDQKLDKLTELITETALQGSEIKTISVNQARISEMLNTHEKRLQELEKEPSASKAKNWDKIVDIVFKGVGAAILAAILAKIGLS